MKGRRLCNLRLFSVIFASLVLGIAFSANFLVGIIFFFILLISTILMFRKSPEVAMIAVVAVSYLVGFFYSSGLNYYEQGRKSYVEEGVITGIVTIDTAHDASGKVSNILVLNDVAYNDEQLSGKAEIYLGDTRGVAIGDRVTLRGSIEAQPLVLDDIGATSSYVDGIRYKGSALSLIDSTQEKMRWRDRVVMRLNRELVDHVDSDTAGFVLAMLCGDKSGITGNVRLVSSRVGIAHLFAVSGLHIGMIATFLVWILERLKVDRKYHLFIIPILLFYAYLCDYSVSVLRATIMVSLFLISRALYMRYDMLSSISLAGTILLLISPMYLFDLSFVMSFLAVISIALFADPLTKKLCAKSSKYRNLKLALASNLAVNIGMLPIMLYVFESVSLLVVPVNLIVIPLVAVVFPIAMILIPLAVLVHLGILLPQLTLPFRGIMLLSYAISSLSFPAINFDVSCYFVITYIILMFAVSRYVFVNGSVKRVPIVVLCVMLGLSLIVPPIEGAIMGDAIMVQNGYSSYSVIMEDNSGRDVLYIMGKPTASNVERAIRSHTKSGQGSIPVMVVPSMTNEDAELVGYYARQVGAEILVSNSDVHIEGVEVIGAHAGIDILPSGNVVVMKDDTIILLDNVRGECVENDYYDIVLTHDSSAQLGHCTPKYYINFAKLSPTGTNSDFTIYIKNGKITNERMLKILVGGD